HHQVGAVPELLHERHEVREVVGVVGVAHDHVLAAGGADAAHEGVAVPLLGDVHHPGARVTGELLRPVGAAVVGDHDLAVDPVPLHEVDGLAHARGNGLGLVEARHYNGQFHVATPRLAMREFPHDARASSSPSQLGATAGILLTMVTVAERTRVRVPGASRGARLRTFLLRHRHLAVALGLGAVLRLITMLGYRPAMWFNDSYEYVSVALHPRPHPIRPDGYGFWLLLLKPFHSFSLVVFTQHV